MIKYNTAIICSNYLLKNVFKTKISIFSIYKRIAAFTLAEVMITLLIIGIVASLVIPALVQDTQDAELKTAMKSFYSSMSNATKLIAIDNGGSIKGLFTNTDIMKDLYASKMNIIKKCDASNTPGNCWHMNVEGTVKQFNGINDPYYETPYPGIVLSNGTMIMFRFSFPSCDGQYSGLTAPVSCSLIRVDINGFKKPNVIGKDIFDFHVLSNSVAPRGGTYDSVHSCSGYGDFCAYSVLSNN